MAILTSCMYFAPYNHLRGCMNCFHSFWIIAIPIMSVVAPTFMWPDILRMYHQVKKRSLAQKITKARP